MTTQERPVADASWDEHYRDERDAAFLYRALAAVETAGRRELFEKLAAVEDRHASRWEDLFREAGRPLPPYATAFRTRAARLGRPALRPSLVLPLMLAEEGREVQSYLGMARRSTHRRHAPGRGRHRLRFGRRTHASSRRRWGGKASPGTRVAPAACSAASSTASTTD